MRTSAHIVIEACALIGAVLCLYAGSFLYEDEMGKIQNKLEEWWAKLDDARLGAVSRHTAFTRVLAAFEAQVLERIYGRHLISLRAFGVSQCLSLGSMGAAALVALILGPTVRPHGAPLSDNSVTLGFAALFTALFIVLAALPTILKPKWLVVWFAAVEVTVWGPIVLMSNVGQSERARILAVALAFSFACDVMFVVVTRWMVQYAASMDKTWKIILIILANALLGLLLFIAPLYPLKNWYHIAKQPGRILRVPMGYIAAGLVAAFNWVNVLLAALFGLLALLVLAHRLFWPMINRPLYALQSLGIARRQKLVTSAGISLLGVAGIDIFKLVK
jgi:hypothetical protein